MRKSAQQLAAATALVALWASSASAGSDPGRGSLIGITDRGPVHMPLEKTLVGAHLMGSVAEVTVKQTFRNPNAKPLEAIYVFPLPNDAAVHGMKIRVAGAEIRGSIQSRAQAKAAYKMAKKSGRTAALLDQERPNIFTQAIANIFPKSTIEVEFSFDVALTYEDGYHTFVFPMVVGRRYIPGDPDGKPTEGWGESPDTDRVPDASKITPPVAKKRSGRNIQIELKLEPGGKIRELESPTHAIRMSELPALGENAVRVELANKKEIPNRDFVVRYRLANRKPAMAVLSHKDARGGFFTLNFEPPAKPLPGDVAAKEITFVIDTSDSMEGTGLETAKATLRHAISKLGRGDTFRIVGFADSVTSLSSKPLANTKANRAKAGRFIDGLRASGGAELLAGLRAGLEATSDKTRIHIAALLTNARVGNEDEILSAIDKHLGDARLFAFGVGAAPNRYLLERLVRLGRGSVLYALPRQSVAAQAAAFYRRIGSPILTDVEIDWKGLGVEEVKPTKIPDLFVGQPIAIVGRFARAAKAKIEVRGKMGSKRVVYEVPVTLRSKARVGNVLPRLWARAKVRELELSRARGADVAKQIERLGVGYGLVTRYTSFVAVSTKRTIRPGDLQTIVVPTDRVANEKPPAVTERDGAVAEDQKPKIDPKKPLEKEAEKKKQKEKTEETRAEREREELRNRRVRDKRRHKKGDDAPGRTVPQPQPVDPDVTVGQSLDVGDGDADDEEDYDLDGNDDDDAGGAEPTSDRIAVTGGSLGEGEALKSAPRPESSVLPGNFRLGVGLALGRTSGANADESSFAAATTLRLDRPIRGLFAIGGDLGLIFRGPENDRALANILVTASVLDLLAGSVDGLKLELSVGTGPSLSSDSAGVGAMGALKLRVPLPVGLQLRYDAALRFGDDESTGTLTGGVEFTF